MKDEREQEREGGADPGAFIGTGGEWAADTIPDGPQPGDQRVAGTATQSTGEGGGQNPRAADPGWAPPPEGHREGAPTDDDAVRGAGEDR